MTISTESASFQNYKYSSGATSQAYQYKKLDWSGKEIFLLKINVAGQDFYRLSSSPKIIETDYKDSKDNKVNLDKWYNFDQKMVIDHNELMNGLGFNLNQDQSKAKAQEDLIEYCKKNSASGYADFLNRYPATSARQSVGDCFANTVSSSCITSFFYKGKGTYIHRTDDCYSKISNSPNPYHCPIIRDNSTVNNGPKYFLLSKWCDRSGNSSDMSHIPNTTCFKASNTNQAGISEYEKSAVL